MILIKKDLPVIKHILLSTPFLLLGIIMLLLVRIIANHLNLTYINLTLLIFIGFSIYLALLVPLMYFYRFNWLTNFLGTIKLYKIQISLKNHKCTKKLSKKKVVDISKIEYHISFDDVFLCIKDINANNYKTIFENPFLNFLSDLHKRYNTEFTLNIYKLDEFYKINDKYLKEFLNNKNWLKLSFHSFNGDELCPNESLDEYKKFIKKIRTIDHNLELLDHCMRLHYYKGTQAQLYQINAIDHKTNVFLGPDDDRKGYDIEDDFKMNIIRTNLRIDNCDPRNKIGSYIYSSNLYNHCSYTQIHIVI